jgi:peroxisomal membrane protein 4
VLYVLKLIRSRAGPQQTTLAQIQLRSNPTDAFWAGLVGGYLIFGRNSPEAAGNTIAQQMALYVFSRVVLGGAKYLTENIVVPPKTTSTFLSNTAWTALASLSWGVVMYLFRAEPAVLQHSMLHSMKYLYVDSETWTSLADFL